jgi:hypothetical protein
MTPRSGGGSRPPSTASAAPRRESHTYGGDDGLRSSSPGRAAEDLDRNTSSAAAGYGGRDPPPLLGADPTRDPRDRERNWELIGELKGQGCPFLYRLPGGANLASQAMWDYPPLPGSAKPGAPALGGPHLAHLGRPSLPHKVPLRVFPPMGLLSTRRPI